MLPNGVGGPGSPLLNEAEIMKRIFICDILDRSSVTLWRSSSSTNSGSAPTFLFGEPPLPLNCCLLTGTCVALHAVDTKAQLHTVNNNGHTFCFELLLDDTTGLLPVRMTKSVWALCTKLNHRPLGVGAIVDISGRLYEGHGDRDRWIQCIRVDVRHERLYETKRFLQTMYLYTTVYFRDGTRLGEQPRRSFKYAIGNSALILGKGDQCGDFVAHSANRTDKGAALQIQRKECTSDVTMDDATHDSSIINSDKVDVDALFAFIAASPGGVSPDEIKRSELGRKWSLESIMSAIEGLMIAGQAYDYKGKYRSL